MCVQRLFIDGEWREGSDRRCGQIINPATEEAMGCVAHASPRDVEEAIDAAERARAAWLAIGGEARGAILSRAAQLIARDHDAAAIALTREQGKTIAESRAEYARVVETLAWHGEAARTALGPRSATFDQHAPLESRESRSTALGPRAPHASANTHTSILPEPIGVVAAFTPWNYPAVIAARKIGAALAAGCTLVLKGAEEAPSAAAHIVQALASAGLPAGVVNLVFGDPPALSAQLLDSPAVRAFTFTGSTAVGKQLAARAAQRLTRCVLELGGHAPVLVFADADLDAAARAIAAYKFECAGQSCNAPSRIFVESTRYAAFVDRFAQIARALHVGDGIDPSTEMGPLANPRRLTALQHLVDDARARGAHIVTGGERLSRRGYFFPPTILTDVPEPPAPGAAAMMTEEPFGPLVSIAPFETFDEAIARANANPYGLAAYAFTAPHNANAAANATTSATTSATTTAIAAARALVAGSVGINELRGVPPDVGIGGIKDSGYGYEGGQAGIDAFLNLKVVRGPICFGPNPNRIRSTSPPKIKANIWRISW
jgi:succinate-semialdehyde dehydrogenase/glutarate-semialdehyde dehydrogenase